MTLRIDSSAFGVTTAHAHSGYAGTGYICFSDDPKCPHTGMTIFTPTLAVAAATVATFNAEMTKHQAAQDGHRLVDADESAAGAAAGAAA